MTQRDVSHTIFGEPEPPPSRRRAQRHRHRPQRRNRRWLVVLLALALVGGATWAAVSVIKPMVASVFGGGSETADFPGPGEGAVEIVITPGETGEDIATTLRDEGVVKTRGAYIDVARADPESAAAIQPGKYALLMGMTAADAFAVLADPANRVATGTTVREGLWASETFEVLSKSTGIPVEDYAAAAKDPEAIGLPAEAEGNVEGWLAPSTYEFPEDSTAAEQLAVMVAQTVKVLDGAGVAPEDRKDVLILASLVEAEAKLDEDRPKIARVFLNRLEAENGPSNGRLESDAAVSYGAQRRSLFPSGAELNDASNPYNTRLIPGLPPGPISNPGAASIAAAANPVDGPWFFFVAVNPITGETRYGVTLDEHNENVRELTAYCDENPKDCGQ